MKILAIGDFHGKCPINLKKICKDNKIDLILCTGDYASFHARKDFFKYCYGKKVELEDIIGKKKVKDYTKKDMIDADKVLNKLDDAGVPVISTTGNVDRAGFRDVGSSTPKWDYYDKDLFHLIAKKYRNIKFIEMKSIEFRGFNIIGYMRSSYPGCVPLKQLLKWKIHIIRWAKRWLDRKGRHKILSNLFKQSKKPIIFLVHNVPYKTKLDTIAAKDAHEKVKGEHYGDYLTCQLIKGYQPLLCVAGHMHESQGTDKIGETLIVNTGHGEKGEYAIINIKNNKVSAKLFH